MYHLQVAEPVRVALPRIIGEELEGCLAQLRGEASEDRVTAVHEARKHLKKARSALRVVRGAIGGKTYRRHNARLREVARRLSEVRDAQVALATFDKLVERFADTLSPAPFPSTRRWLDERRAAATAMVSGDGGHVGEVLADLEQARADLGGLTLRTKGWNALADGLGRAYRDGRAALAAAQAQPTLERLHAWRKRVKDAWYQQRILAPTWPALLGESADQAHLLSEHLGDDHDLGVLRELLRAHPERADSPADVATLLELIDRRRAELQTSSWRLGRRLYAEPPKRYLGRIESYWRAWRAERGDEVAPAVHGPGLADAAGPADTGDGHLVASGDGARAGSTGPATVPEPAITPPPPGAHELPLMLRPLRAAFAEPQLPPAAPGSFEPGLVAGRIRLSLPEPQLAPPSVGSVEQPPFPARPSGGSAGTAAGAGARIGDVDRSRPPVDVPEAEAAVGQDRPETTGEQDSPEAALGDELLPPEELDAPAASEAGVEAADPAPAGGVATVLSTSTGKRFHRPGCRLAGGTARTLARTEAVAAGLVPCLACRP